MTAFTTGLRLKNLWSAVARGGRKAADVSQGMVSGVPGSFWRQHPIGAASAGWLGGRFVGEEVVEPMWYGARGSMRADERFEDALERERELQLRMKLHEAESRAIEMAMMRSASRLASLDPQLYNEVLAGQALPEGAVVLGGRPRVDLMEQLAFDMAQGAYDQVDPQQQLLQDLGVQ